MRAIDVVRAANILVDQKPTRGFNVDHLVLHGSPIYATVFRAFAAFIQKHEAEPFWVYRSELRRRIGAPSSACDYALWKFEVEGYFRRVQNKYVVDQDHLVSWELLVEKVQTRLGGRREEP